VNEFLSNPAVQAGVAPFIAGLAVAFPLRNTRWLAWSLGAAFLVVVGLTMGFTLDPMTSSRKLVLATLGALLLVPLIEYRFPARHDARLALLAVAGVAITAWVLSRLLLQMEMLPAIAAGGGAALFLAALLDGMQRGPSGASVQTAAVAVVLGLGTGVLAVLGASAQLAQIAIAIAAGSGAVVLATAWAHPPYGRGSLGLVAALAVGLAGLLSVFTGSLPWYCLLPVLAAPWAARLVPASAARAALLTALYTSCAAAVPMLLAAALAWVAGRASTQVALPNFFT
jgi:hypothetical protein